MFVKLPMVDNTFRNWSGRSHATVNAQIPPELDPHVARISGSLVIASEYLLVTNGSASSIRNRDYASPSESYSKLRLLCPSRVPGFKKIATQTGISFAAIKLSKTSGTRHPPFV